MGVRLWEQPQAEICACEGQEGGGGEEAIVGVQVSVEWTLTHDITK